MTADHGSSQSRRLGAAMMLLSGVGFGMSGVFTRIIEAGAWQIASWRALIGSVGVATYMLWRRPWPAGC
ncbi:MAG: hypothetical protein F4Z23_05630 [Acidimicrobiaceae bacterium]|nr:hypothetical protein [Acidimicrobiaceae bacterium]